MEIITRYEIFFTLMALLLPVVSMLGLIVWLATWKGRTEKRMATMLDCYNVPRSERRPGTLTVEEQYTEATRRG